MAPDQLVKFIPGQLEGFRTKDDNKGRILQIGTLTYSMAERSYIKNNRRITLLLFDYNNAPIMYHQATSKWASQVPVETDTLTQQPLRYNQSEGWQFYHKFNHTSQLSLGINKRFYLILNGAEVGLEDLNNLLAMIPLSDLPAKNPEPTAPKTR